MPPSSPGRLCARPTKSSEEWYDEFDLIDWFDWSRYETAKRYGRLGGGKRFKRMGESLQ